jgi:hypothetical protein
MENSSEVPNEIEEDYDSDEGSASVFPTQREPEEERDLPQEVAAIPAQLSMEDKVQKDRLSIGIYCEIVVKILQVGKKFVGGPTM